MEHRRRRGQLGGFEARGLWTSRRYQASRTCARVILWADSWISWMLYGTRESVPSDVCSFPSVRLSIDELRVLDDLVFHVAGFGDDEVVEIVAELFVQTCGDARWKPDVSLRRPGSAASSEYPSPPYTARLAGKFRTAGRVSPSASRRVHPTLCERSIVFPYVSTGRFISRTVL